MAKLHQGNVNIIEEGYFPGCLNGECIIFQADAKFPARLDQLGRIRQFLRRVCCAAEHKGIKHDLILMLELSVNEAASNIIKHGILSDDDACGKSLSVGVRISESFIEFEFGYIGIKYCPESITVPVCENFQEHGYGLYVMDQLVDSVSYAYDSQKCRVTLTKRICSKD